MRHGTYGYNKGCRCDECKSANSAKGRSYRESHKDAIKEYRKVNAEAISEARRLRYRQNRESERENHRAYKELNREADLARKRNYYSCNRELVRERNRLYREAVGAQRYARRKAGNDESKQSASRHNSPWTSAEDKIVSSSNLTANEVAFMLGRTIHSVHHRRHYLRKLHQQGESA